MTRGSFGFDGSEFIDNDKCVDCDKIWSECVCIDLVNEDIKSNNE